MAHIAKISEVQGPLRAAANRIERTGGGHEEARQALVSSGEAVGNAHELVTNAINALQVAKGKLGEAVMKQHAVSQEVGGSAGEVGAVVDVTSDAQLKTAVSGLAGVFESMKTRTVNLGYSEARLAELIDGLMVVAEGVAQQVKPALLQEAEKMKPEGGMLVHDIPTQIMSYVNRS